MMGRLEELRERARKLVPVRDAVAFARLVGIEPDPWQERVLRSEAPRMLLNCSRQAGKSTTSSVKAVHRAINAKGSLTLLISPSLRQSAELFRKVTDVLGKVPGAPSRTEDNRLSLTLENGSRIVSLPSSESTIRGFSSVSLIIEDEACFVDDSLYTAVRPMLAVSGGQLMLMSTPNGRRGHFFEAWESGGNAWERTRIMASDVPRISAEFLAEERRTMGESRYRQEYECEFVHAATGLVYHRFDRDKCVVDSVPKKLDHYVIGIDYGFTDDCAFAVLGWMRHERTVYVVECVKGAGMTPTAAAEVARGLETQYAPVAIVGDTGGLGKGYAEEARERFGLPIQQAEKHNKRGYIDLLNDALAGGRLLLARASTSELVEEWRDLPWHESRQREAAGYPNHCADAVLYGWRACWAFLEDPAEQKPKPGTQEAVLAKLAEDEERLAREQDKPDDPKGWARRMARRVR